MGPNTLEQELIGSRYPLVSILTPVYNGEAYLSECIESVLNQTYENWQYVIVNNCSTDRSSDIAKAYAQKDRRVRIHNNDQFVGVIRNHNVAFRQIPSQSKYCKVVHADDFLFPECIMQMVMTAEANPSVGIVGAYRLYGNEVDLDGIPYGRSVLSGKDVCRSFFLRGLWVFGTPTSMLIRSEILRDEKNIYNESSIHADTEYCFEVLQKWDYGFVHQVLTHTRRHAGTLTSRSDRLNTYLPANLYILKKYGKVYLSTKEYERCWTSWHRAYYRFLARNLLKRRGDEFWEYHKDQIERLGESIDLVKLGGALCYSLADKVLHPKETFWEIQRWVLSRGDAKYERS